MLERLFDFKYLVKMSLTWLREERSQDLTGAPVCTENLTWMGLGGQEQGLLWDVASPSMSPSDSPAIEVARSPGRTSSLS